MKKGLRSVSSAILLLGIALTGCDFGSDPSTVTLRQDAVFRYSLSSEIDAPWSGRITSDGVASFESALAARGYSLDQIQSVRAVSGFVEVIFPVDGLISFADRAAVRIVSGEESSDEVAVAEGLANAPDVDEAPLVVRPLVDVASFVREGPFRTALVLQINDTKRRNTEYDVAVKLVFDLEVALR